MKRPALSVQKAAIVLGLAALAAALVVTHGKEPGRRADAPKAGGPGGPALAYAFSEPYTHRNLTLFLIRGKDKLKGKKILTLREALEQKKVVVHETGNVRELIIENNSDVSIFIHSGDIVKGGRQDRCLPYDLMLAPKSGKTKVTSFCVERGRWSRRGRENAGLFDNSNAQLSSKDLKLAAKLSNDQGGVWKAVADMQGQLNVNTATVLALTHAMPTTQPVVVQAAASPSSLQLTLENKDLKKAVGEYTGKLSDITKGKKDVIGYAFAINGEVNSVDVYASADLFRKLWPTLLEASAVEAVAEFQKDKKFKTTTVADVKACMADAGKGKASERKVSKLMKVLIRESAASVRFESRNADGVSVHDSYIKKDKHQPEKK